MCTFHELQGLGMNDDLWDRARSFAGKSWNGCSRARLHENSKTSRSLSPVNLQLNAYFSSV